MGDVKILGVMQAQKGGHRRTPTEAPQLSQRNTMEIAWSAPDIVARGVSQKRSLLQHLPL